MTHKVERDSFQLQGGHSNAVPTPCRSCGKSALNPRPFDNGFSSPWTSIQHIRASFLGPWTPSIWGSTISAATLARIWHPQTGPRQSSHQQEETLLRVATVGLQDNDRKRSRVSRRVCSPASYLVMYTQPSTYSTPLI